MLLTCLIGAPYIINAIAHGIGSFQTWFGEIAASQTKKVSQLWEEWFNTLPTNDQRNDKRFVLEKQVGADFFLGPDFFLYWSAWRKSWQDMTGRILLSLADSFAVWIFVNISANVWFAWCECLKPAAHRCQEWPGLPISFNNPQCENLIQVLTVFLFPIISKKDSIRLVWKFTFDQLLKTIANTS